MMKQRGGLRVPAKDAHPGGTGARLEFAGLRGGSAGNFHRAEENTMDQFSCQDQLLGLMGSRKIHGLSVFR